MALTKVKAGNILLTTPGASSNDVTPATTQYVTTALANLADSAPSTLNTLNELAAALGDDANFSTTVTNSIAAKLPLAGGTMTGALTGTSFNDGYVTWSGAQFNRYGAAIELQFTPTNTATLVKIGGNGSNPTIFNAHSGDASFAGKVGVGVTPETDWHSNWYALQVGAGTLSTLTTGAQLSLAQNARATSGSSNSGWKYINAAGVSQYVQDAGNHYFKYAASGSADAAITWTQAMTINTAGNVGIGEASPANLLHVKASDTGIAPHPSAQIVLEREGTNYLQFLTAENGTSGLLFGDGSDIDVSKIYVDHNTTKMTFVNEASETMTLNGNKVGIGTTTPASLLDVGGGLIADPVVRIDSAAGGDPSLVFDTGAANRSSTIKFHDQGNTAGGFINYLHNGDKMNFGSGSTTGVTMTVNDDKVGVKTVSPSRIFEVELTGTTGSLHNNVTAAAHFGGAGNADGLIQGITLGYKSAGANTYSKTAIVARGLNDGAARQSLAFLVDTAADGGSAEIGNAKLTIHGITGNVGVGIAGPEKVFHVYQAGDGKTPVRFTTGNNHDLDFYNDSEGWQLQSEKGLILRSKGGGHIGFKTGAGSDNTENERVRILTSGGIAFNGDTAAANALDDYEEGTWTPALSGITTNSSTVYGIYTKIGRIVHIHAKITATVASLPGATFVITGLPFSSLTPTDAGQRAIIAVGGDMANIGGNGHKLQFRTNGSSLQGVWINSGSTNYFTYNLMDHTTFEINIHGHYTV